VFWAGGLKFTRDCHNFFTTPPEFLLEQI